MLHNPDDAFAGQQRINFVGRASPAEVGDDIEDAEQGAARQHIRNEVHGPAFVDPFGQLDRLAVVCRADPLLLAFTHLQTLFMVYTMHRLVIDLPVFPAQRNMQSPIVKTMAFGGQIDYRSEIELFRFKDSKVTELLIDLVSEYLPGHC